MRTDSPLTVGSSFLKRSYQSRSLVLLLARKNLQTRYAGTGAGLLWSVVNPVMTVLVYWLVFSIGFKVKPVGGAPFIVVFLSGFIPWMMFSEVLTANAGAIIGNPHLVKKTVFQTELLPVANWLTSALIHGVMTLALLLLAFLQGLPVSLLSLQFLYFFAGLSILCLGMSWLVASLNVFYREVGAVLSVLLNMWFWLTPIAWLVDMLPSRLHWLIKLNPLYFIVWGYQASFVYHQPFWTHAALNACFWAQTALVFMVGAAVFSRLQPEFADAL